MPSRQFYISQAILCSAAEANPFPDWSPTYYLRVQTAEGEYLSPSFAKRVVSWYRDRVREYGAPE